MLINGGPKATRSSITFQRRANFNRVTGIIDLIDYLSAHNMAEGNRPEPGALNFNKEQTLCVERAPVFLSPFLSRVSEFAATGYFFRRSTVWSR